MRTALTVTAPAKVNLYLGVGALRADGYHEVTTVLHALDLADQIVLEPAEHLSLVGAQELGIPAEENLAWKAANAFAEEFAVGADVRITLRKGIPHGAGLGGGSSDAAAVLAGLAHAHGVEADDARVVAVARSLGSDVAFFIDGGCALYGGRGDALLRRLPPLEGHVALVKPPQPVSTAAAYATFDESPGPADAPDAIVAALEIGSADAVAHALSNNMEAAAATLVPQTAEALGWVRDDAGVLGAALAGSGSAVFALCDSESAARSVADRAAALGWWSEVTRLRSTGVAVSEGLGRE